MGKRPSLTKQVQDRLINQLRIGESKHHAKIQEKTHAPRGIFSYSTLKTYMKHSCQFTNWVKENHGVKYVDDAKEYVNEYIQSRIDKGLSAWTIKLDINALGKLYECKTTDFGIETPSRLRADITRSRGKRQHDKHFSEKNNRLAIDFARATGLRRHEMERLKPNDLFFKNNKLYIQVLQGKGGKDRLVPVRQDLENVVRDRFNNATGSNIFRPGELKNRMDIHSYRREYAKALYNQYARPIESLKRNEKYFCRKDRAGEVFDREAMLQVSRALGHNRIDVIANNYL